MKVFGIIGWKNAGKTGLMERLVTEVTARGFSVATIKHAHHRFDVDQPGKDSFRHRAAGARQVLLSSSRRWALMSELAEPENEPTLAQHLSRLDPVDLVLVEGYKTDAHPRLEAHRAETGNALIAVDDPGILAVASDGADVASRPHFDLNDTAAIADFILSHVGLMKPADASPTAPDALPVDTALEQLRTRLSPVVGVESTQLDAALGRRLAVDIAAPRANPPSANSAVDGFGFAFVPDAGPLQLKMLDGRAAAGDPFTGKVAPGEAVRILTGAVLPKGVDTVVMQEHATLSGDQVTFTQPASPQANTRAPGEDVAKGAAIVARGTRLGGPEIALLAAVGVADVSVFAPLRVGVLSTGSELVAPGEKASAAQTYDANRPMLLSLVRQWGHSAVDLGHAADAPDLIRHALDAAGGQVDAIITSGGASAGAEDHMTRVLTQHGALHSWRVAMKPGRALALGQWDGVPIFGLPGNPVAAFTSALVFARPALSLLAGGAWLTAQGFDVPAGFAKSKKAGRREFLRARITPDGRAEVFVSEGSGRVSGLEWASGLIELGEDAREIAPGDPVRFIPYGSFGLA